MLWSLIQNLVSKGPGIVIIVNVRQHPVPIIALLWLLALHDFQVRIPLMEVLIQGHPINNTPCKICNQPHYLMRCPDFKCLSVPHRIGFVQNRNLCSSCLRDNHATIDCTRKSHCFVREKHSAFLHIDKSWTSHNVL